MKKIITLTLALILAFSLAACSFEFGGGTSDGGDPTSSKPTSGNTAQTPDDTSEPPETSKPPETTQKPTDPPATTSWIVGMWRQDDTSVHKRSDWAVCQIFNADGSVIHIGIREYSNPYERIIDVTLGKYRLNGNTLEIYDVTGFLIHSDGRILGHPDYSSNYLEIKKIVETGSRSEVEELTDPNHTLYSAYSSSYRKIQKWSDRDDELNIIDTNKFVTKWPLDATWGLKRVQ